MQTEHRGTAWLAMELLRAGSERAHVGPGQPDASFWLKTLRKVIATLPWNGSQVTLAVWPWQGGSHLINLGQTDDAAVEAQFVRDVDHEGPSLRVSVRESRDQPPSVSVEAFTDGLRHGFTSASPSVITVGSGFMVTEWHHRGRDLLALRLDPVESVLRTKSAERSPLHGVVFPSREHARLLSAVAQCEARRELVVVSPDALEDLHAVRVLGAGSYELVDGIQATRLERMAAEEGRSVTTLRISGADASMVRRTGGYIDGSFERLPGAISSRITSRGEVVRVNFFEVGRRLRHPAPDPACDVLDRVAALAP